MNPTLNDLREAYACRDGYLFYERAGCEPSRLVEERPDWYLWLAGHCYGEWMDMDVLDHCAERHPDMAIMWCASLLTEERLDWCAKLRPIGALHKCASLLTEEGLDWCASRYPIVALRYCASLLSKESFDRCAGENPKTALAWCPELLRRHT